MITYEIIIKVRINSKVVGEIIPCSLGYHYVFNGDKEEDAKYFDTIEDIKQFLGDNNKDSDTLGQYLETINKNIFS
jgi:hypothetical protein